MNGDSIANTPAGGSRLTVSLSPHIHTKDSVRKIMWNVLLALVPSLIVALVTFGTGALLITVICLISCVLTEWFMERFMLHRKSTVADGSALITGLLLALNLPSILPWWMAIIGSIVAIGVGKMSFGGLGANIWNPALVGRVFLLISFPAAMTTWPEGISAGYDIATGATSDASSGATMLTALKSNPGLIDNADFDYMGMFMGNMNGSAGEVGAAAILLGLIYLMIRGIVTWHIPVSVLGSAALFSWAFGGNPLVDLLSGGLMLGACFMATDYVTSPMTHKGQIIFGVMIGLITIIIRRFGSYPEGVSFAILLMNSFVPLINRYCAPKQFGVNKAGKGGAA